MQLIVTLPLKRMREAPDESSQQTNGLLSMEEVLNFCLLIWDLVPLLVLQSYHYLLDKLEDLTSFPQYFLT